MRKMLKEEKELLKFYSVAYPSEDAEVKRDFKKMLTALVRACYEDAAKVAYEEALMHKSGNAKWDVNVGENVAAAIRRK